MTLRVSLDGCSAVKMAGHVFRLATAAAMQSSKRMQATANALEDGPRTGAASHIA